MTWKPGLRKQPDRKKRKWTSNAEILQVWSDHVERGYAENTHRNYTQDARILCAMWGDTLVTTLNSDDINHFVDAISVKCARLQNGATPACFAKHDIATCPLLRPGTAPKDYAACPSYRPLDPVQVWHYLCTLHAFYEWLRENGDVDANPVTGPLRAYNRKHRALFDERRTSPRRRTLTLDEVRAMVLRSPIWHAIAYLLMAKCFLRIHEVAKLTLEPRYCNLEEGWMAIPRDTRKGDKRKGNKRIILDAELRQWMRFYLVWRGRKVKRDAKGEPVTQLLMISVQGNPWTKDSANNFRTTTNKGAQRIGLMPKGPVRQIPKEERVNPHCFREFATTWAFDHDANDAQVRVLRGDVAPGALDRYHRYLRSLPERYERFAPKLGLPSPAPAHLTQNPFGEKQKRLRRTAEHVPRASPEPVPA